MQTNQQPEGTNMTEFDTLASNIKVGDRLAVSPSRFVPGGDPVTGIRYEYREYTGNTLKILETANGTAAYYPDQTVTILVDDDGGTFEAISLDTTVDRHAAPCGDIVEWDSNDGDTFPVCKSCGRIKALAVYYVEAQERDAASNTAATHARTLVAAIRADERIGYGTCTETDECFTAADLLQELRRPPFRLEEMDPPPVSLHTITPTAAVNFFRDLEGLRESVFTDRRNMFAEDDKKETPRDYPRTRGALPTVPLSDADTASIKEWAGA